MVRRYRQRIQGTISPEAFNTINDERELPDGRLFNRNLSNSLDTIILEWKRIPDLAKAQQKENARLEAKIKALETTESD